MRFFWKWPFHRKPSHSAKKYKKDLLGLKRFPQVENPNWWKVFFQKQSHNAKNAKTFPSNWKTQTGDKFFFRNIFIVSNRSVLKNQIEYPLGSQNVSFNWKSQNSEKFYFEDSYALPKKTKWGTIWAWKALPWKNQNVAQCRKTKRGTL